MTFNLTQGAPSVMVTIRKGHLTSLLRTRVQTYYSLYLMCIVACISSDSLILFSTNSQGTEKIPIISSLNEVTWKYALLIKQEGWAHAPPQKKCRVSCLGYLKSIYAHISAFTHGREWFGNGSNGIREWKRVAATGKITIKAPKTKRMINSFR